MKGCPPLLMIKFQKIIEFIKLKEITGLFQFTHLNGVRLGRGHIRRGLCRVSIHAPARGATRLGIWLVTRGGVSIHAPARGATSAISRYNGQHKFQSTHPHGVRLNPFANVSGVVAFQSTHPHGVRRLSLHGAFAANGFQSTHPHGVRLLPLILPHFKKEVSIHAPARGATWMLPGSSAISISFNPRTRTGCDNPPYSKNTREGVSIHAPARGAT